MLRKARLVVLLSLFASTALFATAVPRELIPSSASHGGRVIVTGAGLDAPSVTITFPGGVAAPIITRTATFVETVVPPTAASGNVIVTADGAAVGTFPFTLLPDPPFVKT